MKRVGNGSETPERRGDVETWRLSAPTETTSPTERAAPAAPSERVRSVAELGAIVWATYAPDRNGERGIAGARVRDVVGEGVEPDLALAALAEWARGKDRTGEPYHAIGFTAAVCRGRAARLREQRYLEAKAARDRGDAEHTTSARTSRGLVSAGESVERFLAELARRVGP